MKILIGADWDCAKISTVPGGFEIETEKPLKISIKHPFVCTETMEHQLVLENGWIECYWHKASGCITALEIVPGDPSKKDDLQLMGWIQTKDPRKQ